MKKMISFILVTAAAACIFSFGSYAFNTIQNQCLRSFTSNLTVSGRSAECISKATGYNDTTKIAVTQYLQVHNQNGGWTNVRISSGTYYSSAMDHYRCYSGLSKGRYRVKTIFVATAGRKTDILTKISSEKEIR